MTDRDRFRRQLRTAIGEAGAAGADEQDMVAVLSEVANFLRENEWEDAVDTNFGRRGQ